MTDISNSTASIERKLLKNAGSSNWAHYIVTNLIALQARTKTIERLIRAHGINITEADIGRMYKNYHGVASPRGLDKFIPDRMLDSHDKTFHGSVFYALFIQYQRVHEEKITAIIEAYKEYLKLFDLGIGIGPLSFGDAHRVIQFVNSGDLEYCRCNICKLKHLQISISGTACPACHIIKRSSRPQLHVVDHKTTTIFPTAAGRF